MAKKQANQPKTDISKDEQQLIVKVDKMMATEHQDMAPDYEPETTLLEEPKDEPSPTNKKKIAIMTDEETKSEEESSDSLPPLDIFADAPGAPPLKPSPESAKSKDRVEVKKAAKSETPAVEIKADLPAEAKEEVQPQEDEPLPPRAESFDDPLTAKAIEDIVAHESDVALSEQNDSNSSSAASESHIIREGKHTHRIFWTLVTLVCIIAIAMAVFIIDPALHNPFSHLHWSSIRRHL